MNAVVLKFEEAKITCPLRPVPVSHDAAVIDGIARDLRAHARNLRYTFKDENIYKSLTDFFVIRMVMNSVPLVGVNMDLVKMHCEALATKEDVNA